MNAYVYRELGGTGEDMSLQSNPLFHDFSANLEYVAGDDEYKKKALSEFYDKQKEFSKTCDENLSENNFITSYLCKNLDLVLASDDMGKDYLEKLRTTCYKCYCKHYYLKSGCRMSQRPYIKFLALEEPIQSKYLFNISSEEIKSIESRLQEDASKTTDRLMKNQIKSALSRLKRAQTDDKAMYIVNDGFEEDKNLKSKEISSQIIHLPRANSRYKFCNEFFDEESVPPQLSNPRKSGQILYYVLYALLLLIIVSFGFIMLYQSVDMEDG